MDSDKTDKNKLNHRRAFRIYEQVDLFYHKLKINQQKNAKFNFNNVVDNVVQSLVTINPSSSSESSTFEQRLPDPIARKMIL